MSSSQWVASITTGQLRVFAAGLEVVRGSLGRKKVPQLQQLVAPGADGARYREVHKQAPPLVLLLVEPVASGTSFSDRESEYADAIGQPCTLTINLDDTVTWKKAICTGARMIEGGRTGQLIGFGDVSGSTRTLLSVWSFDRVVDSERAG